MLKRVVKKLKKTGLMTVNTVMGSNTWRIGIEKLLKVYQGISYIDLP